MLFLILMLISAATTISQKTSANPQPSHTEAHQQPEEHAQHPQASIPVKKGHPSDPVSEQEHNDAITNKELLEAGAAGLGIASVGAAEHQNRKTMRSLEEDLLQMGKTHSDLQARQKENRGLVDNLEKSDISLTNDYIFFNNRLKDNMANSRQQAKRKWEKQHNKVVDELSLQRSQMVENEKSLKADMQKFSEASAADQKAKDLKKLMKEYNKDRGQDAQMTAEEILQGIENKNKYHLATKNNAESINKKIKNIQEKIHNNKISDAKENTEKQKLNEDLNNFLKKNETFKKIASLQEEIYNTQKEYDNLNTSQNDYSNDVKILQDELENLKINKTKAEEEVNNLTKLIQENKNQIEKLKEGTGQNQQQAENISENDVKKQQNQPVEQEQKLNEAQNIEKELAKKLEEAEKNKNIIENQFSIENKRLEEKTQKLTEYIKNEENKRLELLELKEKLKKEEENYKATHSNKAVGEIKNKENLGQDVNAAKGQQEEVQNASQNTSQELETKLKELQNKHNSLIDEIADKDRRIKENLNNLNLDKYNLKKSLNKLSKKDEHINTFLDKFKEVEGHTNLEDEHIGTIEKILEEHAKERTNIEALMADARDNNLLNKINEKNEKINNLDKVMKKVFKKSLK